jgi:molybdopterin molybdotransferase
MINYKQAKKVLRKSKISIKEEFITSINSLNRACSRDIYSKVNYPAGNNAAFDGVAIRSKETLKLNKKNVKKFNLFKTLAAGDNPKIKSLKKFQAVEIMTGALLPKTFDTIIPIEQIRYYKDENKSKYFLLDKKINKNQYVRYLGSDYKKRDLIIKKGTIIQPSHILALKTLGIKKIQVKKKPNIIFFSTGNEISESKKIQDWKVRNSNSHYIKSLSENFLFNFKDGGTLKDKDEKIFEKIIKKNFTSKVDMIITIGAVSAGKFDFIPRVVSKFKSSGFFKNVAIRPGKPILFSKIKNKAIFGLPGNPISSAACFRFFVYPYLLNILNIKEEKSFKASLKNQFNKKKNFTRFLKGKLTSTKSGKMKIEILKGQESFRVKSFVKSNIWGVFNAGKTKFKRGELIDCYLSEEPNLNIFA